MWSLKARKDKPQQDKTSHDTTRQNTTQQGKTRHDTTQQNKTGQETSHDIKGEKAKVVVESKARRDTPQDMTNHKRRHTMQAKPHYRTRQNQGKTIQGEARQDNNQNSGGM